jgi:metal-dependent amidase/aminoacylase/carboxypeptidase family protein
MAILCGLAIELHRSKPKTGRLFYYSNLLKKMVAVRKKVFSDTKFAAFNPDYVLPYIIYLDIKNQIIVKNDTFTCAVNIIIKLEGITAHAGEPEKGINPAMAIASIMQFNTFKLTFQKKIMPDYSIYTMWEKSTVFLQELEKFILR